ncbi:alternative ribosome rescue aminoacyl-tRNA hydrolase ArfB [Roseomonas marmotae]|uniref:Aminoacyl-tRNA hydrolase n=1 Tax=Roseomonas marmotae TaxID=2768161 RepID=A0ABS3KD48_9PROT|nr:alternative ribosome rescue aminoacyl-tRNA hydrolase ArfB [Roseomonas marmotae]MBO1074927.1 aminoacyl-tRNA hydrolase [Roseomonas marmotae]QTI80027.1 aminoacyl-tRNA hydrolase [Roseomonas marmotae]
MLQINARLAIPEEELRESFVRASGPGGQNVNKVSSAVRLAFDVAASPSLPEGVKQRLARLAGRRLGQDGVLVIAAQRFRSLEQNRQDARARLLEMLREAAIPPTPRIATRVSRNQKRKRVEEKRHAAGIKRLRGRPGED